MTIPFNGNLAIEAEGLVKVFGTNHAVDGVDLRVKTGTVYGVLGPNVAGKTTTISMLATLLEPDAGSARIFGHDVVKESNAVRQLIGVTGVTGVTGQYASVDEKVSGIENMRVFGGLLGLGHRAVHLITALRASSRFSRRSPSALTCARFSKPVLSSGNSQPLATLSWLRHTPYWMKPRR